MSTPLKQLALALPPVRRLYEGYTALAAENDALKAQVATLELEKAGVAAQLDDACLVLHRLTEDDGPVPPTDVVAQRAADALKARVDGLGREIAALKDEVLALRTVNATHAGEAQGLREQLYQVEHERTELLTAQTRLSLELAVLRDLAGERADATAAGGALEAGLDAIGNSYNALSRTLRDHLTGLQSMLQSDRQLLLTNIRQVAAERPATLSAPATGADIAHRWLDLVEAALTGTLTTDSAISPWSGDDYDPSARMIGRDWPASAYTMIGVARMRNLRALCETVLADGVEGDVLEAGVWRGGACIYMKAILTAHAADGRRVFVADSFRGLPPPDPERYPADAGDTHHEVEELAISRSDVEAHFRTFGLLDDDVVFLEGWFKDTLPTAPVERLAILRLDGDMYESTMDTLVALYDKVSPGGYVIIDDHVLEPCAMAVKDFREERGITAEMVEVDGAAVYWRVP